MDAGLQILGYIQMNVLAVSQNLSPFMLKHMACKKSHTLGLRKCFNESMGCFRLGIGHMTGA